jgi:hypothetical protein
VEIIDLARPGEVERLRAELSAAGQPEAQPPGARSPGGQP